MNQELWNKVEDLFHAALERAPEARQSFLDTACNGDAGLRGEVEFLLSKEKRAGSFLEVPAMEDMTVTLASGYSRSTCRPISRKDRPLACSRRANCRCSIVRWAVINASS